MGLVRTRRKAKQDQEGDLLVWFDIFRPGEKGADANGMIKGRINLCWVDGKNWKVVDGDQPGLSAFRVGKFVQIVRTTRKHKHRHMLCG
jgi:hypothetical protein